MSKTLTCWKRINEQIQPAPFLISPCSSEIIATDEEEIAFKDLDAAILVGSMPRKEGMERKDLLKANVAIFKSQGSALEKFSKKTVRVLGSGFYNTIYNTTF